MFLKNYTSSVSVFDSIRRIEQVLIACNVTNISKEYSRTKPGKISAVTFTVPFREKELPIRLPANEERALEALWSDYCERTNSDYRRKSRADFQEQAERTAWRIVKDWVEVQMSMIELKQAETAEVFLPYIWDGRQTAYQMLSTNGFRALLPDKTYPPPTS